MAHRIILWFRNDLRLHDNETVSRAVHAVRAGAPGATKVLPVFCFDPRAMASRNVLDHHAASRLTGSPKTAGFRAQFQMESVNGLKSALRSIGSDLFVYYDQPQAVLPGLLSEDGKNTIFCQEESTYEELAVDRAVRSAVKGRAKLEPIWGHTMFHVEDLPFKPDLSDLPDIFTPFRGEVEKRCKVRPALPPPAKGELPLPEGVAATPFAEWSLLPLDSRVKEAGPPPPHPNAVLPFKGGEAAALARLQHYLWDTDAIAEYFETRNGMLGGQYSTKFSPWLAHGCLSPRRVYHEVRRYEKTRTENKSTYWVIFELIWRDFFRFFAIKHGSAIFAEGGIVGRHSVWNTDPQALQRWKEGKTGMPLVDANMRELRQTGFMSNRGRQNVASYLILDLGVDWRLGADWFEFLLLDHDVTSNWGNWVSAAGLTGGRLNKFNITKQSKDYDLKGDYIRTWVPELARVPSAHIHEPWQMPRSMMEQCSCIIGEHYPSPMATRKVDYPSRGDGHGGRSGRGRGRGSGGRGREPRNRQGGRFE